MSEIEKHYNGEIHVDFEEIPIKRKSWEELSQEIIEQHNEIERLHSIIKEVREYIENNTYKTEWGDLEQDNEDINISEDLTEKEFIEELLEILDKESK